MNNSQIKQIGDYVVYQNQVLGHGSFGNVYRGIKESTKQEVAAKVIPRERVDTKEYLMASLKNEIKILQSVKSENIVGFYDMAQSKNNYYIIQQLCDSDLSQLMIPGKKMPEQKCIEILTQICNGFLALVREGIIHRDLKPANIMIRGNTYKIGDFGFSKQFDLSKYSQQQKNEKIQEVSQSQTNEGNVKRQKLFKKNSGLQDLTMNTTVGTPLYMSLQILKSMKYTSKCDIWALGFIFYEMLHGQTPWRGNREYELGLNIQKIPLQIKRKDLSPVTENFLRGCLQIYEEGRLSWNEVFVHPIFKDKFVQLGGLNKQFENQMKTIMTKLRFYFNLNKDNLENYLTKYGFMNNKQDLNFQQYFDFLKAVNSSITKEEAAYIFQKTDTDNSGSISIDEIVQMLKNYGIEITTQTKIAQKIKKVFITLHKIIIKKDLSLKKVFNDFDKKKTGRLNFQQFNSMAQTLSRNTITIDQARLAFKMIDQDGSDSLELAELEKHYKNINQLQP